MADMLLDIGNDLTGIGFVPAPVQVLGDEPELDDEVARQVLRLDLAALLPPQPHQGGLVIAHDDAGIRTADEVAPIGTFIRGCSCDPPWHMRRQHAGWCPLTSDVRSESSASI